MKIINIPKDAMYDLLKEGKCNFYDGDNYQHCYVEVKESRDEDKASDKGLLLVISKADVTELLINRYVNFWDNFYLTL